MRKLLIPLLAAFALSTAVNASGFWLLTTTVKKTAAFKEYVQVFIVLQSKMPSIFPEIPISLVIDSRYELWSNQLLFLDKVPILIFLFKGYYFQQITLLKKNDETRYRFLTNCLCSYLDAVYWVKNKQSRNQRWKKEVN